MSASKRPLPNFKHTGDEKKEFVEKMFDEISPRYDFLNLFLSFGIDHHWRQRFLKKINIKEKKIVLDVACGTGDIGFKILKRKNIKLINIDLSKNMLSIAKKKAFKKI